MATQGELASPLPLGSGLNVGEMRLQSDFALAHDSRTSVYSHSHHHVNLSDSDKRYLAHAHGKDLWANRQR